MDEAADSAPALVLVNGPPASGKSTLARSWAEQVDAVEVIDIDTIRGQLDLWPSEPVEAGLVARRIALGRAAAALDAGRHVLIPQFLARDGFIEELAAIAAAASSAFVECVLVLSRSDAVDAFVQRGAAPDRSEHRDAAVMVDAADPAGHVGEMFDSLETLVSGRPQTRRVRVERGDERGTLARLQRAVPEVERQPPRW